MENNEKKDIESTLKNILFFTSLREGFFNYNIPIKSDIEKFNSDKSTEPSFFLFEYICYKLLKNILISNKKINPETIIITDQFLCNENSKELLTKYKATYKKNIIICIQNTQTLKWTIIAFLNLEEQIKNYFDINNKKPIKAKILSSNLNSDEDDIVLNATMDKLEYAFDFKSPDDIQFEVDSFNIHDQPNSGIFLLNFIKELMLQDETKISEFIQKIYDEVSNMGNPGNKYYFNIFNNISEEMNNIYDIYLQELNDFMKNNNININLDDELNSDEEEEALKIMEKENEETKNLMRQKERKLRQKLYRQKLMDKNMVMYKEFGVIKEEDNESESESIDFFGKMKEKEEERLKFKENLNKKNYMNNNKILNNVNVNININVNNSQNIDEIKTNIFKADNDIQTKNKSKSEKNIKLNVYKELEEALEEFELEQEPIKNTEENIKLKKEEIKEIKGIKEIKENNQKETQSEDITNILNKIEEKEKEKSKEFETNTTKAKIPIANQTSKEQKNQNEKNKKEENKKEKKKTNKSNNNINIFRNENIELKKRGSVPKTQIKIKKLNLDFKSPNNNDNNNKTIEKLKKSFTNMKRPDNKDLFKEKDEENNNNSLLKKKSVPIKELKSTKSKELLIPKNSKEIKQINSNINNNGIKNTKNNASKKQNVNKNKEEEKNEKIIIKEKENSMNSISINKEPRDNLSRKSKKLNIIIKTKNLSKKNSDKYNNKKSNSQIIKTNQEPHQSYATKKSTSSSNKSEETDSLNNDKEIKSIKRKIRPFNKQSESIEEKATLNVSLTDNPINMLPPQKIVERNALLDLRRKEKEKDIKDISSVNSTKKESDYSSNINIENIGNDFSETEKKSEFSDKSYTGRERIRKSNIKRNEKINPPRKVRNSKRYEYSSLDKEDTNKICGCIGEQANGLCIIF